MPRTRGPSMPARVDPWRPRVDSWRPLAGRRVVTLDRSAGAGKPGANPWVSYQTLRPWLGLLVLLTLSTAMT